MEMNEKIKFLRQQKGLTLEQVGDYVGVGKSTVRKWENGMIENMRRDKIAKLAAVLGTTPDYLMGWNVSQDEWSVNFCNALSQALAMADKTDIEATGVNVRRLESVSCGNVPISLSEACSIADEIGSSLDYMVGLKTYEPANRYTNSTAHSDIDEIPITPREKSVIIAYRNNPNMQNAVDKLLGVEEDGIDLGEDMVNTVKGVLQRNPVSK